MRILLFINNISCAGGSERAASVLANKLADLGYDVILLSWMGGAKQPFFDLNPAIKVMALFQSEVNIYKSYLQSFWLYYGMLKRIKPDCVIDVCTALSLLSVPLRMFLKFRLISWEHFNTTVNWNAFTPRLARYLVSNFASNVVVLTEADKLNYENSFGARNVVRISNPITITHTLKANLNSNIVLTIGRFTAQKGYDLLLSAWKLVHTKMPNLKLQIVGDGELRDELHQLANQLEVEGSVIWSEPTNQIEGYYENAALYVMSSRFEGLPLVLIEAKTFGLPIVSFNCETGPRDIVRHQIDGILVAPEDIEAMAGSIVNLMQNDTLRKQYSQNALADLDRFNLDEIAKKWIDVLK